jgi:hypothetical protein
MEAVDGNAVFISSSRRRHERAEHVVDGRDQLAGVLVRALEVEQVRRWRA